MDQTNAKILPRIERLQEAQIDLSLFILFLPQLHFFYLFAYFKFDFFLTLFSFPYPQQLNTEPPQVYMHFIGTFIPIPLALLPLLVLQVRVSSSDSRSQSQ
jgi:hypothetical protein